MNAEEAFFHSQDHKSFFASGPASMVLTQLERGLEDASPVIVLTGEPGVGKTTVVREALAHWGSRVHAVWFEVDSGPTEKTLLKTIRAFGGHARAKDERPELIARMAHALNGITERGATPLLIVDDAHAYELEMLAEVGRIESAAIAADQNLKLLLVGEPELTDMLDREELEILSQRLAVSCRLDPMEQADTRQYLNHRVTAAGGGDSNSFSRKAAREIHAVTRGVPSAVNALAAESQRRADASNAGVVTPDHVRAVMAASRRAAAHAGPIESASVAETRIAKPQAAPPPVAPRPVAQQPTAQPKPATPSGLHAKPATPAPRPATQTPSGQHARPGPAATPGAPASQRPATPLSATPNAPGGPKHAMPVPARVKRVPPPQQQQAVAGPDPAIDLDSSHPRVKEWVSRFTDGQPLRIGGSQPLAPLTEPSSIPDAIPRFADEDEPLLDPSDIPPVQEPTTDEIVAADEPLPLVEETPAPAPAPAPRVQEPEQQPVAETHEDEPHAIELPKEEPLVSAADLTPPPLIMDEKPAEATPSGSMKRPEIARTPPSAPTAKQTPSGSMAKPTPSGSMAKPTPSGSLPKPAVAAKPTPSGSMAKPAVASKQTPSGSMPKPAAEPKPPVARIPETSKPAPSIQRPSEAEQPKQAPAKHEAPPVLTKKDVKAHKPATWNEKSKPEQVAASAGSKSRQPAKANDNADEDESDRLPSVGVYRVLGALIPIVLILGMAATAIVLSRRSAFEHEPDSSESQVLTAPQNTDPLPVAPPAPPPLVVTPDTEATPLAVIDPRFCLSVGTYLFSDRARARTEQLARSTHMKSWVITTTNDGSYTYRVMLGGFANQADAERVADRLLSTGVVSEALVEPIEPKP